MNRFCIALATLGGLFAGGVLATGASAAPLAPARSCVAASHRLARVAATLARPQACCSGTLMCAQFLSTITLVHPEGGKRT